MKRLFLSAMLCGVLVCPAANAEEALMDVIVVSANKIEKPSSQLTNNVSVISKEEIAIRQPLMLTDMLKNTSGIFMTSQEGPGGMNAISVRGAHPMYTQYRWNGIPLRDTADINSNFTSYLGSIMFFPESISRIEVLKGSQGTLYGSSAIGGVISIYNDSKWNSGSNAAIRSGAGSYGTGTLNGSVNYGDSTFYINFNPQMMHTDGYEKIWQDQGGYNLSSGYKFSEDTAIEFFSFMSLANHADYSSPEIVDGYLLPQKASNKDYRSTKQVFSNALTLTHKFSDFWQTTAKLAYTRTDRTILPAPTPWSESTLTKYRGDNYFTDIYNTIHITEKTSLIAGMDYEGQKAKVRSEYTPQNNSDNRYSVYAKLNRLMLNDKLVFNLGGRYNYHQDLGSKFTWDTGLSYLFETKTKIYGNIATGYRTPSLYEIYGDGGIHANPNLDLKPETSVSYEAGLEQKLWQNNIILNAAVFKTDYKDKIYGPYVWGQPTTYVNQSEVMEKGYELSVSIIPCDFARLNLSFVRVLSDMKNEFGKWEENLNQIPDNKFIGTLYLYPMEKLTLAATGRWEDGKQISYPSFYEHSFFTVDLAVTYDMDEHFQLYGNITNLLDKDYTVLGWHMPGITANAGIQYTF